MQRFRLILLVLLALAISVIPALAGDEEIEPAVFDDGRINNYDVAAPVVVFGMDFDSGRGLDFWAPIGYEGWGECVMRVTPEDIAAVPEFPEKMTMIARSDMIDLALYRLPTGEFQVRAATNVTETYVLTFDVMGPNAGYHSVWEK